MSEEKEKTLFEDFKQFEFEDLIQIGLKEFELSEGFLFDKSRIMSAFPAQDEAILNDLEGYQKVTVSLVHLKQVMKYYKTSKKNLNVLDFYFRKNYPLLMQDDKLLFGLASRVEEDD